MQDYKRIILNSLKLIKERYSHLVGRRKEYLKTQKFLIKKLDKIYTPEKFIEIMTLGLSLMKDTHINLIHNKEFYRTYQPRSRKNYDLEVTKRYVSKKVLQGKTVFSGQIDDKTGYIWIKSFHPRNDKELKRLIQKTPKTKNLIIDLRANSGGSSNYPIMLMNRIFEGVKTNERRVAYFIQQRRNKKNEKIFTKPVSRKLFVDTKENKKIILLVGNTTMSSGEIAVLQFLTIPGTISIGDETKGNSGNPKAYSLLNLKEVPYEQAIKEGGTYITLPSSRLILNNKKILFDRGIEPNIKISWRRSIVGKKDKVLEKAIGLLQRN